MVGDHMGILGAVVFVFVFVFLRLSPRCQSHTQRTLRPYHHPDGASISLQGKEFGGHHARSQIYH